MAPLDVAGAAAGPFQTPCISYDGALPVLQYPAGAVAAACTPFPLPLRRRRPRRAAGRPRGCLPVRRRAARPARPQRRRRLPGERTHGHPHGGTRGGAQRARVRPRPRRSRPLRGLLVAHRRRAVFAQCRRPPRAALGHRRGLIHRLRRHRGARELREWRGCGPSHASLRRLSTLPCRHRPPIPYSPGRCRRRLHARWVPPRARARGRQAPRVGHVTRRLVPGSGPDNGCAAGPGAGRWAPVATTALAAAFPPSFRHPLHLQPRKRRGL